MTATLILGGNARLGRLIAGRLTRQSPADPVFCMPLGEPALTEQEPGYHPVRSLAWPGSMEAMRSLLLDQGIGRAICLFPDAVWIPALHSGALDVQARVATLLDAARLAWLDRHRPHHIHFVSSAEVFGGGDGELPLSESAAYAPQTVAAGLRAAIDQMALAFCRQYGLHHSLSYPNSCVGAPPFPGNVVRELVESALHGRRWPLYGDGDGESDLVWDEDAATAIVHGIEHARSGDRFGVGLGNRVTDRELLGLVAQSVDAAFAARPALAALFPLSPMAGRKSCISLVAAVVDRRRHPRRAWFAWQNAPWQNGLPRGLALRDLVSRVVALILADLAPGVMSDAPARRAM